MTPQSQNGHGKGILLWITGALLGPVFLATFGLILNQTFTSGQRLAALEAQYKEIQHDLHTIADKLDRLLERRP